MIVTDDTPNPKQMAIVEKYEHVIAYLYPILQNAPRKHGVARDLMLETLLKQVELIILAGKSSQPSRVYSADANLAYLRFWLRFAADPKQKILTPHQHRAAQVLIGEVGAMIGAWAKSAKSRG
jgi:hypothetical protein